LGGEQAELVAGVADEQFDVSSRTIAERGPRGLGQDVAVYDGGERFGRVGDGAPPVRI
jgi:hypothetical protein